MLGGLPTNLPPAGRSVTGTEALPDLCEGAVITAERLRQAAVAFTRQGRPLASMASSADLASSGEALSLRRAAPAAPPSC